MSGVKMFNGRGGRGGAQEEAVCKFVVLFGRRIGDARGRGEAVREPVKLFVRLA